MTDELHEGMTAVQTPSGGDFFVHELEEAYYNDRVQRYLADNHFTNVSDYQDLDRLILAELLVWRWGLWVSQDRDYWGDPIDINSIQKAIREHSAEIRQLKKALSLDKETRDKERGEDSVDSYLNALRQRAKEFGYMRNEQAVKSIILFQELIARITLMNNCDEEEALEQKATPKHILQWIEETAIPEFQEIDKQFRETSQKYWIRKQ